MREFGLKYGKTIFFRKQEQKNPYFIAFAAIISAIADE